MIQQKHIWGGLLPTKKEDIGYSFGAVFGYLSPNLLPFEYDVGKVLEIKNQNISAGEIKPTYVCVAESLCSVSEFQEKIILEPAYTIKVISEISGTPNWIFIGTSLKIGAEAALKGFLTRQDSPYSVEKDGVGIVALPDKWNKSYDDLALKHAKLAYFWIGVSGKLSMFDAIRCAMYGFRDEARAVQAGVIWNDEWSYVSKIEEEGTPAGGHAVAFTGWKGDYLKLQNSIGKEVGENGIQWVHKDIVNKCFSKFKAVMYCDIPEGMTKEGILKLSQRYRNNFLANLLDKISELLNKLYNEIIKNL